MSFRRHLGAAVVAAALSLPIVAGADYPRGDDHLLIEYHRYSDKLAERDPTPRIRLYGSGRLVVYFPHYMARAGTYHSLLSDAEVRALVNELSTAGVTTLSAEQLNAEIDASVALEESVTGMLHYQSETVTSTFLLDLTDDGRGSKPLRAKNLLSVARSSATQTLERLAAVERALMSLAERDDLKRAQGASGGRP